jgi:hypothetical protein
MIAFALAAASTFATDTMFALGHPWTVQDRADWSVENGPPHLLRLIRKGEPGVPRRPTKFALIKASMFKRAVLEVEMLREGRSLIIVYAYQDDEHYNYAHISSDEAQKVPVHNGIFHVYGGERVRISSRLGPASFGPQPQWTPVKLVFDGKTGRCQVFVNGKRNPSLQAIDLSLTYGHIGLGSFNETGAFRNLKFKGEPVDFNKEPEEGATK